MNTILLVILFFLALILAGVFFWYVGRVLAAPEPSSVGTPPEHLPIESIELQGKRGNRLAAWFIPGEVGKAGLLLLHGIRSNRRVMLERASFLHKAGYSILLFDFQAHGESAGKQITFGHLESQDTETAFNWLQEQLGNIPIGVLGISLGGASIVLSSIARKARAVILESTFSSLKEAVANRIVLRLGRFGRYLVPLLLWQVRPRLGISPHTLAPIDKIHEIDAPLLIMGGTKDVHTLICETQALYEKAVEPKEFWAVEGAEHENFHAYLNEEYEQRILDFFERSLSPTS